MLTAFSLPPSPCHQKILMCRHILEVVPTVLAVSLWSSQHYPSLSKSFKAFISSAVFCLKVVHLDSQHAEVSLMFQYGCCVSSQQQPMFITEQFSLFAQLSLHSWDLQLTAILVLVARALCITFDSILIYTYFWSSAMNRASP